MKKSDLWTGLAFTAVGTALLLAIFLGEWDSSLLCGFGGGALGSGLATVWKYFYWISPKRAGQYREKLEEEQIRRHDELLEKLRDRSGRYAYILGLLTAGFSIMVIEVLREFRVIEGSRLLILYLGAYTIVQWAAGIGIFYWLKKRY